MHLKCIQAGFVVTQDMIRLFLATLDPAGVSLRSRKRLRRRDSFSKGANYLWHMDGYDKLKPYGLPISGCIDGFSLHIIWLRVGYTNNDPRVIAGYYMNAVNNLGGCPRSIRPDFGTENRCVEQMQTLLRIKLIRNDVMPSFIYGTSIHNQRIEAWWGILRKHNAQFWMNVFENLKEENFFDGGFLDKALIQICFMEVIQV